MDASEPKETTNDRLSINVNAPCTNRIAGGDYIEVHLHIDGGSAGDRATDEKGDKAAGEDPSKKPSDLAGDMVEVLVPKAVKAVRQIQAERTSVM